MSIFPLASKAAAFRKPHNQPLMGGATALARRSRAERNKKKQTSCLLFFMSRASSMTPPLFCIRKLPVSRPPKLRYYRHALFYFAPRLLSKKFIPQSSPDTAATRKDRTALKGSAALSVDDTLNPVRHRKPTHYSPIENSERGCKHPRIRPPHVSNEPHGRRAFNRKSRQSQSQKTTA